MNITSMEWILLELLPKEANLVIMEFCNNYLFFLTRNKIKKYWLLPKNILAKRLTWQI